MAIRTYGLSGSGMDIDQLVTNMMKAQRVRYDSMVQKKTIAEWKKTDLNAMYTAIKNFHDGTVFSYRLTSTLSPKQVSVSDASKVTATANADATNGTHTINVKELATGVQKGSVNPISTGAKDSIATQIYGDVTNIPTEITFKISSDGTNFKEITVDTSQSIYEFVSSINKSGTDIQASYDATLDRLFISTKSTGADVRIEFAFDPAAPVMETAARDFLEDRLHLNIDMKEGTDALFDLDGIENLTQKTNTFTVANVTYDLKSKGESTVTVKADTDKTVEAVKSFVEAYNTLLATINGELSEARYKDYLPLTADQRKSMSESEIKAWEERAKSGMLLRNPQLQNLVYKMRNDIANPIAGLTGAYNSMSSIGISTGAYKYTENGKLYIDEKILREALEKDPDIVKKMFASEGDSSSQQGIVRRLYTDLDGVLKDIQAEAGLTASITNDTESTLAKLIRGYDKDLTALDKRLIAMETRYYNQFNAMETALSKLSQQSNWLAQQLGSGS